MGGGVLSHPLRGVSSDVVPRSLHQFLELSSVGRKLLHLGVASRSQPLADRIGGRSVLRDRHDSEDHTTGVTGMGALSARQRPPKRRIQRCERRDDDSELLGFLLPLSIGGGVAALPIVHVERKSNKNTGRYLFDQQERGDSERHAVTRRRASSVDQTRGNAGGDHRQTGAETRAGKYQDAIRRRMQNADQRPEKQNATIRFDERFEGSRKRAAGAAGCLVFVLASSLLPTHSAPVALVRCAHRSAKWSATDPLTGGRGESGGAPQSMRSAS